MEPNLPVLATIIPNTFRSLRLYTAEVDSTFQSHHTLLQLVHAIYAQDHPRINFDQTLSLMVDTALFQNPQLPLDFEHLAVAFSLSRLQVCCPARLKSLKGQRSSFSHMFRVLACSHIRGSLTSLIHIRGCERAP